MRHRVEMALGCTSQVHRAHEGMRHPDTSLLLNATVLEGVGMLRDDGHILRWPGVPDQDPGRCEFTCATHRFPGS